MGDIRYADMTLARAATYENVDPDTKRIIRELARRVESVRQEQDRFRVWCNRADDLYYSTVFTQGGADLWPTDSSATIKGRSHVSINSPKVYVDVPSSLQGVKPIENMLATDTTTSAREAASEMERIYSAWKNDQNYELLFNKATVVKSLYGRTAGRVYWDADLGRPVAEVIEQPRNLYMGYKSDKYDELEWAAYVQRYEPNALVEAYGVDLTPVKGDGDDVYPLAVLPQQMTFHGLESRTDRDYLNFGAARIEVWDYWCRKPIWKDGVFSHMVTTNTVIAGTLVIQGPDEYPEYEGNLPYVPLFNSFIPGIPSGRSELHDSEHLIREKYEKVTAGSQMISNGVAGDFWQLVGPDAPTRVPPNLKPKRNELVGPGPGNRIEVITPFIAQFQLEQYLTRIDRELAAVSGLNDLLLGLAPAQVLSSSKAINALIANYEARMAMPRKLLYEWRRSMWDKALLVYAYHNETIQDVVDRGAGFLEIKDPSLAPRDDMETATRASNLVSAKLWSQRSAMDAVGIDDPETEQDLIREESTDATLWPERVQVMAQLMAALQSLGLNPPQGAVDQAQGQAASGGNDLRAALGGATADNTTGSQTPDTQGQTPPIPGAPPSAGGEQPFAQAPTADTLPMMQGMLQNGEAKGRIMTQQKLGRR